MKNPDDSIPTRRSLIERLKNWEDQDSWRDFFETYWRLIHGVALQAGLTPAEAQEVVQETVIAVAKKIPEFQYDPQVGSFKSWLLHTTRWKIADQFRKRSPARPTPKAPGQNQDQTATVEKIPDPAGYVLEDVWDKEWQTNLLEAALERVKRKTNAEQFQMFDLYAIKNWPVQKVARTLGVNVTRVYLAKHRISQRLKKEIRILEKQQT